MDENERLLKTAINLHYHDRPNILLTASQIIQEYCNGEQTCDKYCEVLQKLRDLMSDLPETILLYFLTTIPDSDLIDDASPPPLIGLMKQIRLRLIESIKSVLSEYITNAISPLNPIKQTESSLEQGNELEGEILKSDDGQFGNVENRAVDDNGVVEIMDSESCGNPPEKSFERLVDICAEYVIANLDNLNQLYERKRDLAWTKINANSYTVQDQQMCYSTLQDINKKRNWLRLIESGYVSGEELLSYYGESEILLRGHLFGKMSYCNSTQDEELLMDAIREYVSNPL
ncbi:uncharacterized protein LOC116160269 isoform X2 [Photinus pyralis]|uniref:uncharacterized protein LOC116160269 isoform X2 n=1 Tax=Photinus pyralis TaxID=7054 RepID=UPI001266F891|nr:uncharacterized protein LOC116160269 isoform X2 [Photinus pyralis]